MPRIDDTTKQQRKERIWLKIRANQLGITEAEIAQEVGLERRTVNNYLRELVIEGRIIKDGRLWYPAPWQETRLRPFELTPEEAMTLYLGARLLVKQHDKRNEPAETALLKLAQALRDNAGVGKEIEQAAQELARRPIRKGYQPIFRDLVRAYIYRKKVCIRYKPLNWERPFETTFSTYLIEPSLIGSAIYLIGHSSIVDALRVYKLERVQAAELTCEDYTIPEDFPGLAILRSAWNIMTGEELIRVVLRFSPRVRERVEETIWHPSQSLSEDPEKEGYLRWTAEIANTQDILPWIRSWGADCEVLAPEVLRKYLAREARRLGMLYGMGETKPEDDLIAHLRKRDGEEQPLIAHLTETAQLAERFAAKVGLPEIGKIMGLLHDFGKASQEYQNYLRSAEGLINPDEDEYVDYKAKKGKIDHSTAGAQLVYQKLANRGREGQFLAQFLALAIASHHSDLIDCLTPDGKNNFQRRIEKPDEDTHFSEGQRKLPMIEQQLEKLLVHPVEKPFFAKLFQEIKEEVDSGDTLAFKQGLLARFLLSCLLDADRLSTADFEFPGNELMRQHGKYISWDALIARLEKKFDEFARETAQMEPGSRAWEVNQIRTQVGQACINAAKKPKGIYHLTVPTGGGKTLASLRFALHHAREHNMDRIFYIAPYITIIDQNADTVREILEPEDERDHVVLEHHSNLTPKKETRRHNLLAENWDAPVVFTTQVQFLEALFGGSTRDARRMHQLANSIIILDEVQTIPIKLTHMFTTALRFLTHDCSSTVVLCTATQPPFDKTGNPYRELNIGPDRHIIQNEEELFQKLKRVEVHDARKPGGYSYTEIADLAVRALQEKGSVLIIVNTRAVARALYQEIKARNLTTTYHLSTNMCPAHRLVKLEAIKAKLDKDEPVICVSTQLIEAGVDVDFGAVIRSLAGLDSIAQAAGRCNRHGRRNDQGSVWVVNPRDENVARLPDIMIGGEKTQTVLDTFKDNPEAYANDRIGLQAIEEYYRYYYQIRKDKMDYPVRQDSPIGRDDYLFNLLARNVLSVQEYRRIHRMSPGILLRQSFRSAGRVFHVIEAMTRGVIVPYRDGKTVITDLCRTSELGKQHQLLKRAQHYSVNLFVHQFDKLLKQGAVMEVQAGTDIYYLDEQYYSDEFGWSDVPLGKPGILFA